MVLRRVCSELETHRAQAETRGESRFRPCGAVRTGSAEWAPEQPKDVSKRWVRLRSPQSQRFTGAPGGAQRAKSGTAETHQKTLFLHCRFTVIGWRVTRS